MFLRPSLIPDNRKQREIDGPWIVVKFYKHLAAILKKGRRHTVQRPGRGGGGGKEEEKEEEGEGKPAARPCQCGAVKQFTIYSRHCTVYIIYNAVYISVQCTVVGAQCTVRRNLYSVH